jgi:hypothetical protein
VVGATHLKIKSGLQNELIRHTQAMELCHRAEEMTQKYSLPLLLLLLLLLEQQQWGVGKK